MIDTANFAAHLESVLHRKWLIACAVGFAFVAYQTALLIYYFFFHPLRKFPGPSAARLTKLYTRRGNFYGRKSEIIHAVHVKYGPVVRVGPNEVSFATPAAYKEIYESDIFAKDEKFYRSKKIVAHDFLLTYRNSWGKEAHKQRRRLVNRGFSQSAMLEFEPNIDTKITNMLGNWSRISKKGEAFDVFPWTHWFGFDVVHHLLFDEDPESVKQGIPHHVWSYFKLTRPLFIVKELFPYLAKYGIYLPGRYGRGFRAVRLWKGYALTILARCRAEGVRTPFLKQMLYGEKDMALGRPLTDSEIAEECMGGMFGGSGTTANTFVYILWATLNRPDIVSRLHEELVIAFPDRNAVPDHKTCSQLPLLQAVIDETLRRYPTILATLPRMALEETTVQGFTIPKGTTVGCQNYTISRNEEVFPDAECWDPDRWLRNDGNEELRKQALTAFSIGSRRCIGINLARMELNKVTAAFFRRFDGTVDPSMTLADMRMYDTFNAAPCGGKLLLNLTERP
ncbi:hypothetical protein CLAIMM_12206 [Cladophialophora immunda]|nr:hypothetical protein CLAIMM_12206 [Cladophialophora immunda]